MGATPHDTPNASKKLRALADIDTVVIHYTGSMSLEGTLSWFESPDSKVSYTPSATTVTAYGTQVSPNGGIE